KLRQPVHVLQRLAGDGVGEEILVDEPALLRHGPAADEMVPKVGLVVAVERGSDEDECGREQEARPASARQQYVESVPHAAHYPPEGMECSLLNYKLC